MSQNCSQLIEDLNGEQEDNSTSPSQLEPAKPATVAGFRILDNFGYMKGTENLTFRKAKLHDKGEKWFIWYSYRGEGETTFKRYKMYAGLNQIKDLKKKREHAETMITGMNALLLKGFDPRKDLTELTKKTTTLFSGLNYFKLSLANRGLRKRTVQSYESVLRLLYEGLKEAWYTDINKITKQHIGSFLRSTMQKNKWSNTTYNNNLTFIRSIFNYLVDHEMLDSNPASKVKPLPQGTTRNRYFDDDTFDKIKAKAEPDLLRFLMFLYHTGTRPNEARQLKYEHIQGDLLFIPSSISKNKKDDYVPLADFVRDNYKGHGFIFGTSVNYFSQKFNKLKKELGLAKEYTLYSIKHTAAVRMARRNVPPYAMMQFFRHSGLEITMAYLRDLGTTISREALE